MNYTEKNIKVVVLAAGNSKRMKSDISKIVHKILGKEIINILIDNLIDSGIKEENIIVIVGKNGDEVKSIVKSNVKFARQEEQLGTAHALLSAEKYIKDFKGELIVTVGDNPYVNSDEIRNLINYFTNNKSVCTFISAVFPDTPPPYGRVIRDENNDVIDVVEEIEATEEQLKIREVNSSIYMFDNKVVFPLLKLIDNNNAKKEYYLTDIIKILKIRGYKLHAIASKDYKVSIGINNKWELAVAERDFAKKLMKKLAEEDGVIFLNPDSTTIEYGVEIGRDTIIYPCSYIACSTKIGKRCKIGPNVYLKNIIVNDEEKISFIRKEK